MDTQLYSCGYAPQSYWDHSTGEINFVRCILLRSQTDSASLPCKGDFISNVYGGNRVVPVIIISISGREHEYGESSDFSFANAMFLGHVPLPQYHNNRKQFIKLL